VRKGGERRKKEGRENGDAQIEGFYSITQRDGYKRRAFGWCCILPITGAELGLDTPPPQEQSRTTSSCLPPHAPPLPQTPQEHAAPLPPPSFHPHTKMCPLFYLVVYRPPSRRSRSRCHLPPCSCCGFGSAPRWTWTAGRRASCRSSESSPPSLFSTCDGQGGACVWVEMRQMRCGRCVLLMHDDRGQHLLGRLGSRSFEETQATQHVPLPMARAEEGRGRG